MITKKEEYSGHVVNQMVLNQYHHQIMDSSYLRICNNLETIKLVIVGRDPFPSNPSTIPFCKINWDLLRNRNDAGFRILSALNTDFNIDMLHTSITPKNYFIQLARRGIVFLNASYYFLGKSVTKSEHKDLILKSLEINLGLLNRASNVLLCGDSYKMLNWFIDGLDARTAIPHPCMQSRNRGNANTKLRWDYYWNQPGVLATIYNL